MSDLATDAGAQLKKLASGRRIWFVGAAVAAVAYWWWTRPVPAADGGGELGAGLPPQAGERVPVTEPESGRIVTVPGVGQIITLPDGSGVIIGPGDAASGAPGVIGGTAPKTNAEWEQRAISFLVAKAFSPAFAQSAVVKALSGEGLTIAEKAAVGLAVAALGNPPQGMPSLNADPPPRPGPENPVPAPKPLLRKAAPDGPALMSIKTPLAGGTVADPKRPGAQRFTWPALVPVFYGAPVPSGPRLVSAGAQLRAANMIRGSAEGSGMWMTVGPGATVSVPKRLL